MFNALTGMLTSKGSDNVFLLNSSGIEWDISVSAKTLSFLPDEGEQCRLYIYFYHRDDAVKLYGFYSEEERLLFLELLKVNGIGVKQALKMLSFITAKELAEALDKEDIGMLSSIPGIGKKTAQKIFLTLKGKLVSPDEASAGKNRYGDIVDALYNMGFDYKKALKAVDEILKNPDIKNLKKEDMEKEIFKQAIVILSS